MNFLSSALNLISTNSIPYTLKEKVVDPASSSYPNKRSIWTIYNGINPKNDSLVSIFEFGLKDPANFNSTKLAINSFKKLKSIKFPGIVSVVDFIENDSFLYIITERITPLNQYIQLNKERITNDAKVYGIYSVAHALDFINSKANCLHGKLDLASSVYVNAQGDWKLFGFELLTNLTSDPDQPIYRLNGNLPDFHENLPTEIANGGVEVIRESPFKFDAFKLGVFIISVFTVTDFSLPYKFKYEYTSSGAVSFTDRANVPRSLLASVARLIAQPKARITVSKFIAETNTFFMSNTLVKFYKLLDEIKFEDQATKLAFFKTEITQYIDAELPPGFLDHKVLPEIIGQYKIVTKQKMSTTSTAEDQASLQETTSVLLNHILKLSSALPDEFFSKSIKPIIFNAFTLADRAIRLILLKYLPQFRERLTDSEVQGKVFSNLITGLQDTNFFIRESTLTSITSIIDKVSVKQVNQDLLKILAKSQMDPKPSIRTNTLILIINISSKIYANSRNSVVITALAKSLRDSFTPCKLAALSGFERLLNTFSLEEICSRILGHLAISLMDPKSYKVRQESKRIFALYLDSVEEHAASLPQNEEDEDAEEKKFYENSVSGKESKESVIPEPKSSLAIGWNVVNRLVASDPITVGGTLQKSLNTSTPDITRVSSPKPSNNALNEWDDTSNYEDGWDDTPDNDEGWDETDKSTGPASRFSNLTESSNSIRPIKYTQQPSIKKATSNAGLMLSSKKKVPVSGLNLNLSIDDGGDVDDAWGDEW